MSIENWNFASIKNWIRFQRIKKKYIEFDLKGGLCNKLHGFICACDIAIKNQSSIIEPYFGWKEKILFSDIYDLNYFNNQMNKYYCVEDIIIPREYLKNGNAKKKIVKNRIGLRHYFIREEKKEKNNCKINMDSTKIHVLKSLKLKKEYEHIIDDYTKDIDTAIQVRTESDWVKYSKVKKVDENETLLITLPILIKMLADFPINGNLFFTSGENHPKILKAFKDIGHNPFYFYDSAFEYEINAAINFEICSKAKAFIGLSRSSYSNLISMKRALLNNDNSYIYNYKDKIIRRIDKGLHDDALKSITKEIIII